MAVLKQSTAYTRMFLLVQSSDHITGLTAASPTVNLSKAGAAFAAAGGVVTEVANGWYKIALTTTDTNTLGDLAYHITATSADPTDFVDQVTANILGDTLPVNVLQINGTAQTAADLGVLNSANGIETSYSMAQAMRVMLAALCGKVSGLPGSPVFKATDGTTTRISATTDVNGNRTAVTLTP